MTDFTMNTATVTPIRSSDYQELNSVFNKLQKPYGQGEITRFNTAYQRVRHDLSRHEKRRAEDFVDALLADLADEDLATKIFGVV
ncbi:MAG: hypothetical protein H6R26_1542 [Proteobacteria bacterium]|nr:hypothetical protein [Pseudomonadota bacterium]